MEEVCGLLKNKHHFVAFFERRYGQNFIFFLGGGYPLLPQIKIEKKKKKLNAIIALLSRGRIEKNHM